MEIKIKVNDVIRNDIRVLQIINNQCFDEAFFDNTDGVKENDIITIFINNTIILQVKFYNVEHAKVFPNYQKQQNLTMNKISVKGLDI